mgnify:FL=1
MAENLEAAEPANILNDERARRLADRAALYAAVPGLYREENKTADVSQFRAGKTNNDIQ